MGAVIGDGEEDGMSDDLVDELQELAVPPWLNSQARAACRSAADEIERLRAVIAEALAVPEYWTPNGATDGVRRAEHMRSILAATGEEYVYLPVALSRVPQGAAEPRPTVTTADHDPDEDLLILRLSDAAQRADLNDPALAELLRLAGGTLVEHQERPVLTREQIEQTAYRVLYDHEVSFVSAVVIPAISAALLAQGDVERQSHAD